MSAAPATALRIGELARRAGTTPRTIRYYEELGLLPAAAQRAAGSHRVYGEADLERLRELIRLRELLGLSLDELGQVIEAEDARAALRAEIQAGVEDPRRLRELLTAALGHLELQLGLVRRRQRELAELEEDLSGRRARVLERLGERREPAP